MSAFVRFARRAFLKGGLPGLLCALAFLPVSLRGAEWRAGIARTVITPAKPMWMAGYGGRNKPSEGTLTDLWAKALVLESPSHEKVCLISLDLVGLARPVTVSICQQIQTKYGLERRQIALCCSHTHCGPVTSGNLDLMYAEVPSRLQEIKDYTADLEQRVVAVVGQALQNMSPAKLAWGTGHSTMAVNRRENKEPQVPQLRTAGLLKGPVDYDVPVLTIRSAENQLRGVLFGYACHATVMSFYQWSGDWPGFAMLHLEKKYPGTTALFFAGCGADQNPLPRREEAFLQHYGNLLGTAVAAVIDGHMESISGELGSRYAEIPLAFDKLPTTAQLQEEAKSKSKSLAIRALTLLKQIEGGQPLSSTYPYPVQVWQLGTGPELTLLGGEVVVDYSLRLKRELSAGKTWVGSYSNDIMAYIPSTRVLKEGGYEAESAMIFYGLPTRWGPAVEESVVQAVHTLHRQLHPARK